ncbi:MAG: TerB family tellurite resistance protein [Bacteroidaceae bacterium]|nr:TerB family tellurite resistance protein [Bacteroidaceae bacterium]
MAKAKWIGGFLGLLSGGPIGALAGFILGALFDTVADDNGLQGDGTTTGEQPYGFNGYKAGSGGYNAGGNGYDAGSDGYDRTGRSEARVNQGTRNGFLFSLLTLASYIIRADGKVMHSEMEAVRQFLRMNFGERAVEEGNQIMLKLFERQKQMEAQQPGSYQATILECCQQLSSVLPAAQRLQLLSFLATLAKADGHVAAEEIAALREVTRYMGLSKAELNSMLGLGSTSLKDAYAVLEIDESATDDEVRAAYKRLVVKHHPDRVASLGEDIRQAAEKKMREINEARDLIYKARGL